MIKWVDYIRVFIYINKIFFGMEYIYVYSLSYELFDYIYIWIVTLLGLYDRLQNI